MGTAKISETAGYMKLTCLFYHTLFLGADFDASLLKDDDVLTERDCSQVLNHNVIPPEKSKSPKPPQQNKKNPTTKNPTNKPKSVTDNE